MAIGTHSSSATTAVASVEQIRGRLSLATKLAGACLAVSVLGLIGAGPAPAQPAPVDARVVWVRDERVYIASPDSAALGEGARLTFVFRGKPVAAGEVTRVVDREMVVARLTSGALPREKDLKRLRVLSQPAQGPRSLRVGYPSRARATLFFACDRLILAPPLPPRSYRVEARGRSSRIIPEPGGGSSVPWPETLWVRPFDEAADEEIALERGELDVAVFWPGELSAHMREQPRWEGRLSSPMPRGCVVALWIGAPGGDTTATGPLDDSLLTSLNRELFRGDLEERWRGRESLPGPPERAAAPRGARYEVDPACPGRPVLERFLARAQGPPPSPDERPVVRLVYLHSPPGSRDSIAVAAVAHQRAGGSPSPLRVLRVDPVFAFACPVLFDPRLGPYLRALGVARLVELFECAPSGGRP